MCIQLAHKVGDIWQKYYIAPIYRTESDVDYFPVPKVLGLLGEWLDIKNLMWFERCRLGTWVLDTNGRHGHQTTMPWLLVSGLRSRKNVLAFSFTPMAPHILGSKDGGNCKTYQQDDEGSSQSSSFRSLDMVPNGIWA